jgi:hypothetical protein
MPAAIATAERKPFLILVWIRAKKEGPMNSKDIEKPIAAPLRKT